MQNHWRLLAGFAATSLLVSWLCWLPLVLAGSGGAVAPLTYLHLLGSLGPAVSGLLWARLTGERAFSRLVGRIVSWRVAPLWHLVAWLAPFALMFAAGALAMAVGDPGSSVSILNGSAEYPELPVLAYWGAVLIFYGFGEEIGWRGFALPLLQQRLHPFWATLVLATIWGLWHIPLFFFTPGLASLGLGGDIGWFVSLGTGAFLLTWLFNGTRGSILVCAAFHATMDIAFLGSSLVMTIVGAAVTVLGFAAGVRVALDRRKPSVLLDAEP